MAEEQGQPKKYKGQPWILYDTVVARSYLLGDTSSAGLAVGSQTPAISANGELVFFNAGGRNKANFPWYTNLDTQSMLAYGLEVWQVYVMFSFPTLTPNQNNGFDFSADPGVPPTLKLIEAILNYSVLTFDLGQENQIEWPLTRFGGGGGIAVEGSSAAVVRGNNGVPDGANVLKLPEPIMMPRTQNLSAKIRIAPEAQPMIGTPAAPGVGNGLLNYAYRIQNGEVISTVSLQQVPYSVQLGLVGRRVKYTQYGQLEVED